MWILRPLLTSCSLTYVLFFFLTDPATTYIYTLSLHDALPIYAGLAGTSRASGLEAGRGSVGDCSEPEGRLRADVRSEEHTSELQSLTNLVCRLLHEKKKKVRLQRARIE